jgi:hypothetical protein
MFILTGKNGIIRMRNGEPFVYTTRRTAEIGRALLSERFKQRLKISPA